MKTVELETGPMKTVMLEEAKLEGSEVRLLAHAEGTCIGPHCTLHNRSEHHMRGFPQQWRHDRGIMERRNPFGGACPDPDSPWPKGSAEWVHGCITNPYSNARGVCSAWVINGVDAAWISRSHAVTKDGRVWSFVANGSVDYKVHPHEVVPTLVRGQLVVSMSSHPTQVRKIVLTAWRGPRVKGHYARVLSGDGRDVRLDNLVWEPMAMNRADGGRRNSKLVAEQVKEARRLRLTGMSIMDIREKLGTDCTYSTLRAAITGERWSVITDPPPVGGKAQRQGVL